MYQDNKYEYNVFQINKEFKKENALQILRSISNGSGKDGIILDFSSCRYISTSGISAFTDMAIKLTKNQERKIFIYGVKDLPGKLFSMLKIFSIIPKIKKVGKSIPRIFLP